jgi:glyoxylase-like metal-dependent hydrolase (beta-lactamase superfamily II)
MIAAALLGSAAGLEVSAQSAPGVLEAAEQAMGTANLSSLRYEGGDGALYLVGAALTAGGPWRNFVLKRLVVDAHYVQPALRQAWELEPGPVTNDGVSVFGGARQEWLVHGRDAWDVRGNPPKADFSLWEPFSQSDMGAWRSLEIWLTPPGFIKAAAANRATVRRRGAGAIVSFTTADGLTLTGYLNAQHLVERIETALPNTVMGDMPFVTTFASYEQFGTVTFPKRIVETVGGFPYLELTVTSVTPNGAAPVGPRPPIPPAVCTGCARGNVTFKSEKLGDGVWYLDAGDNFASIVVEFKDYILVFECPHGDERSGLVMAEARRLVPNKPIRYLATSHWHFDHLGSARSFAAEGATVLIAQEAMAGVEKYLNTPHMISPDNFARTGRKRVKVEGVQGKRVLSDGTRTVELYVLHLEHAEPTLFAYLPKEKVLVTTDVAVAPRPRAPPPRNPVPDSVQLYTQLVEKKIDVERLAGVHWGVSTWKDLLIMVGKSAN